MLLLYNFCKNLIMKYKGKYKFFQTYVEKLLKTFKTFEVWKKRSKLFFEKNGLQKGCSNRYP